MTILFKKDYSWEDLYDLGRDVAECIDPDLNQKMPIIDMHGEFKGKIRVVVEYIKE